MSAHSNIDASPMAEAGGQSNFGDVAAEFKALCNACGVFDLGNRAKIALAGKDRVRWLNGMATNNIRNLTEGQGVYAFLLNPQGHILGDLYAYNRGESFIVDTDRSQVEKVLATFDHYIIMDDVDVTNVSDKLTAIGVAGPEAAKTLSVAGFEVSGLQPLNFMDLSWRDIRVTTVCSDNESVPSYELWLPPENAEAVWDALARAGARPAGSSAVELLRIACGIPRYGQDIRERDLPQETEQQRALHFNKGCYIGQEIVERIRSRGNVHRKYTGFLVDGPLPAAGAKIQSAGKDAGEITSVASLPLKTGQASSAGKAVIALGYIRREIGPGSEVAAGDTKLIVADLPFRDILKN